MKKNVTLQQIAGYATERMAWQLLSSLSQGKLTSGLSPDDILVEGDHFCVAQRASEGQGAEAFRAPETFVSGVQAQAEASSVWTLGALAFYALQGLHILEGRGGRTQTANTPIPAIVSARCSPTLSALIRKCLSFDPAERPTLASIRQQAEDALRQPVKPRKRLTTSKGKSYGSSLLSFWPEEMVLAAVLLLLWLCPLSLAAQTNDAEMQQLVRRCVAMRSATQSNAVAREFEFDTKWTLMDEIAVDKQGECTMKDPVETFGLNDVCFRIAKYQGGVTNMGGRFTNGQDDAYDYSLIEVTVKAGKTVSYVITGREGRQDFAVVPHSKNGAFAVKLQRTGGQPIAGRAGADGVSYVSLGEKLGKHDKFTLSITNSGQKNMAFVIVNHNTRK